MVWKLRYKSKSYTIFKPPHKKNGTLNRPGTLSKKPVSAGESEAPTERAMPVTPEAAERSSGERRPVPVRTHR